MRRLMLSGILLFLLSGVCTAAPTGDNDALFVVGKSQQRFEKLFNEGISKGYFYYEELTRQLLPFFKGLPYGAGGAGCPSDKTLVNFYSFDCVTFVESFWALSYTIFQYHSGHIAPNTTPFEAFTENLNHIRYFGGENCGMEFRIHYFTQQMEELDRSGLAFNVAMANGKPFRKKINYISENPESFGDVATSSIHKSVESVLNKTPRFYYPMRFRHLYYPMANDGDIIAFSSVEPGLDVSHTGIVTVEDGRAMLNHASGKYDKVVLGQDLDYYLSHRTKVNGFFVYRPQFN